jgi:hypothetical protein
MIVAVIPLLVGQRRARQHQTGEAGKQRFTHGLLLGPPESGRDGKMRSRG